MYAHVTVAVSDAPCDTNARLHRTVRRDTFRHNVTINSALKIAIRSSRFIDETVIKCVSACVIFSVLHRTVETEMIVLMQT